MDGVPDLPGYTALPPIYHRRVEEHVTAGVQQLWFHAVQLNTTGLLHPTEKHGPRGAGTQK